jgi:hypothetical protein
MLDLEYETKPKKPPTWNPPIDFMALVHLIALALNKMLPEAAFEDIWVLFKGMSTIWPVQLKDIHTRLQLLEATAQQGASITVKKGQILLQGWRSLMGMAYATATGDPAKPPDSRAQARAELLSSMQGSASIVFILQALGHLPIDVDPELKLQKAELHRVGTMTDRKARSLEAMAILRRTGFPVPVTTPPATPASTIADLIIKVITDDPLRQKKADPVIPVSQRHVAPSFLAQKHEGPGYPGAAFVLLRNLITTHVGDLGTSPGTTAAAGTDDMTLDATLEPPARRGPRDRDGSPIAGGAQPPAHLTDPMSLAMAAAIARAAAETLHSTEVAAARVRMARPAASDPWIIHLPGRQAKPAAADQTRRRRR